MLVADGGRGFTSSSTAGGKWAGVTALGGNSVTATINGNQLVHGEGFSVHGVRSVVLNPFRYQPSLEDTVRGGRDHGLLWHLMADCGGRRRWLGHVSVRGTARRASLTGANERHFPTDTCTVT